MLYFIFLRIIRFTRGIVFPLLATRLRLGATLTALREMLFPLFLQLQPILYPILMFLFFLFNHRHHHNMDVHLHHISRNHNYSNPNLSVYKANLQILHFFHKELSHYQNPNYLFSQ